MMLRPVTSTRDDDASGVVTLYNSYGAVVGMWSKRNGRAMLGDGFYVLEDASTDHEGVDEHE